jgi:hypothetical protein
MTHNLNCAETFMAEEDVDLLIREVVFSELEDILCIQREAIRLEDHIAHDLNADGDDLSFCFMPKVAQRLGLKLTQQDWNETGTVQSVLLMLKKYKSQIESSSIPST